MIMGSLFATWRNIVEGGESVFTSMIKDLKQKTISCQMHDAGGAYADYGSLRSCVPRHVPRERVGTEHNLTRYVGVVLTCLA